MTDHGYYRCNERLYYISMNENIAIEYSLRKGTDGRPVQINKIYEKILKNDYFLSPYTTWTVRLATGPDNDASFARLVKFANETVDVELIGDARYVSNGLLMPEICNSELDKYYRYYGNGYGRFVGVAAV